MQGSLLYHAAGRGFEKCVRALLAVGASTTLPQVVENKVCIATLGCSRCSKSKHDRALPEAHAGGCVCPYTLGQGSSVIV